MVQAKRYSLNRLQRNCSSHAALVGAAWVAFHPFLLRGETLKVLSAFAFRAGSHVSPKPAGVAAGVAAGDTACCTRNHAAIENFRWRNSGGKHVSVYVLSIPVKGTWCSGITSASHAEGPGLNPQCVHTTFGICPNSLVDRSSARCSCCLANFY